MAIFKDWGFDFISMAIKSNALSVCYFLCLPLFVQAQEVEEITLKALWIGKFTYFIEWPSTSSNSQVFTIATLQNKSFHEQMTVLLSKHSLCGKPVKTVWLKQFSDTIDYQVLVLPEMKTEELNSIVEKTKNKPILLIGDTGNYAQSGVHINFYIEDQYIKFEINETSIQNSGFFVSYRLLNIARIVEPVIKE